MEDEDNLETRSQARFIPAFRYAHIKSENGSLRFWKSRFQQSSRASAGPFSSTAWPLAPNISPGHQAQTRLSRYCSPGMSTPAVIKVKAIRQAWCYVTTCIVHLLCCQKYRASNPETPESNCYKGSDLVKHPTM